MYKYSLTVCRLVAVAMVLGASSGVLAQGLNVAQLRDRPLLWPEKVATTTDLSDGRNDVKAGTEVQFVSLDPPGVVVTFPNSDELTVLELDMTDFIDRANAMATKLPEAARNLTLADLASRTDLRPAGVKTIEDIQFNDKMRKKGSDIGAYRLQRMPDGSFQLVGLDPDFAKQGVFHQRQLYTLGQTDFLSKLRELFDSKNAAASETSLVDELKGKLVDAKGETLSDEATSAKYYVVYSAASWCGFCTQYNPTFLKAVNDLRAKHPDVQIVYYSSDKSAQDMQAYMQKNDFNFPAVAFDKRLETSTLLSSITGSTPQVVVLSADGKLIHDGAPAGMNGANAALNTLKRELSKAGS